VSGCFKVNQQLQEKQKGFCGCLYKSYLVISPPSLSSSSTNLWIFFLSQRTIFATTYFLLVILITPIHPQAFFFL